MDLRFVNRTIPAPELGKNIGRTVKILQCRDRNNGWMWWMDVPTEEEKEDDCPS